MSGAGPEPVTLHASAVAVADRGLMITGASGSGKTRLTLELMALGAALVADDQTRLTPVPGGPPMLSAPAPLAGLIEIRGAGILETGPPVTAPLWLIADLDRAPESRMPTRESRDLCAARLPVILCAGRPGTAATLMAILRAGALPDPDRQL